MSDTSVNKSFAGELPRDIKQALGFSDQDLLALARTTMPFGKYQGKVLIRLPEEYLFWFSNKGFPPGRLGVLMALALELKIEGLDRLLIPLIQTEQDA